MGVITVDTRSRQPIYEQLIDNIRENVLRATLAPGEQLPSVRSLAGELAINPNTIQKAYMELERLGIIYSLPGRGSFVCEDVGAVQIDNKKQVRAELTSLLESAKAFGFSPEELHELIDSVWKD